MTSYFWANAARWAVGYALTLAAVVLIGLDAPGWATGLDMGALGFWGGCAFMAWLIDYQATQGSQQTHAH